MRVVRSFAPGRAELAGNHTDHQGGRVIAAAVSRGVEMELRENGSSTVRLESEGFAPVELDVADPTPREYERNTTAALVRGVIAGLSEAGAPVAGFDAKVSSTVPAGSGLSSSAAFELALAAGLAKLYGEPVTSRGAECESGDRLDCHVPQECDSVPVPNTPLFSPITLARIAQRAESVYFGKPCGLMDQTAVACGGVNLFDFAQDPPSIEGIDFDFSKSGHALCLIDAHCDHSRYTAEYAQVAKDMFAVARFVGATRETHLDCHPEPKAKGLFSGDHEGDPSLALRMTMQARPSRLSQISEDEFLARLNDIRAELGDLPAMRALHYYHEMRLVDVRAHALREGDFAAFLAATRQSGASSAQYLQNVSTFDRASQPAMVALALADLLLEGEGAARIHGGGFGGTIQAFVPGDRLDSFIRAIDVQLGEGSCQTYDIVNEGAHAK